MGLFRLVCVGLLAVAQTQVLQNCSVDTGPVTVASTGDAAALAASLQCSNGDFAVEWVGEVFVEETILVTGGTSLNITGVGTGAIADGGNITRLFYVSGSSSLHLSDMTLSYGHASGSSGGAVFAEQSSVSFTGNTSFISNHAGDVGGAIYARASTVSWDGDGTHFSNNNGKSGGAIYSSGSTLSWHGDGTHFSSNSAHILGGAIYASGSTLSWGGDCTHFSFNSADGNGGAIYVYSSTLSWDGDGTQFSNNSADGDGGAIYVYSSTLSWDADTVFHSNVAAKNGGALALMFSGQDGSESTAFICATFIGNRARTGGALYISKSLGGFNFTDVTFVSNSASDEGGAVASKEAGGDPITFSRCIFSDNVSNGSGGAVGTLSGLQEFISCHFEGNFADVGGALNLGGTDIVRECSFSSNSASTPGLAVAVVPTAGSANISGSTFGGNDLYCAAGEYRDDTLEGGPTERFETVCSGCPGWNECSGCSIGSDVVPTCEAPLEHTTADIDGVTLRTLTIAEGYWRATNESVNILACYNADACRGGGTGADSYCAPGYKGPYCAVCETDFSPSLAHTCTRCSSSRRQGFMAAIVIAAILAVFAVGAVLRYLLSTNPEAERTGRFHGWMTRALGAVPVRELGIIVVVLQILTMFADVTDSTYPGVYQDVLSYIAVVINFDLGSFLSAGCLWSGIDFHGRLLASTLGPLVVVGFLAMTYRIAVRMSDASIDVVEEIRRKHLKVLFPFTYLVYSSSSSMVFQTFACDTLDDGIVYLRADYSIHYTDAKHKFFVCYSIVMLGVYPMGIPALYAALLYRYPKAAVGLRAPYRTGCPYYEVVECVRRISLTGLVVFILPNTVAQIAITIVIALFFSTVFEAWGPYDSWSDRWLSRVGHVIVFLSMFDLLLLKADVSDERDQSQAALAGVFVALHVLMVLAVVVQMVVICCTEMTSPAGREEIPETRHAGLDDVPAPAFPASWRSFLPQRSISAKSGRLQASLRLRRAGLRCVWIGALE